MDQTIIAGIPCYLESFYAKTYTAWVLRKIEFRFPEDYARILQRVTEIRGMPEQEDGTQGQYHAGNYDDENPAAIDIDESLEDWKFYGVLAHELGHACATNEDEADTGPCPYGEWSSELAADRYAYKWGFGHCIERLTPDRDKLHHLGGPGTTLEAVGKKFIITDEFRLVIIGDSPDTMPKSI